MLVGIVGIFFLSVLQDSLLEYKYLWTLFETGLETHSYTAREDKWLMFLDKAFDEAPLMFLIGHGKAFFGQDSGAMDSEYVFFICIYGICIFLFLLYKLKKLLFHCLKCMNINTVYPQAVIVSVFTGLCICVSSSYFVDIRIGVLFCLLVLNSYCREETV